MDAIVYSLKVSVFLIAFYLMFKSLMSRETLHRANRYLILGSIGLSFVLPLWHITLNAEPGHAVTAAILIHRNRYCHRSSGGIVHVH